MFQIAHLPLELYLLFSLDVISYVSVLVCGAVITKYHSLGGLEQQKHVVTPFRKIEIKNQRISKPVLPTRLQGRNFLASIFWQWPAIFGVLGLQLHHSNLCLSSFVIVPGSLSLYMPFFLEKYHSLYSGSTLLQYNLNFTNYIYNHHISNKATFEGFRSQDFNCLF